MGIIRKIGFIFLVSLALNLSSQTPSDTVYFSGKRFVKHIVNAGESLKSIAQLHDVTTLEIKKANELNKRLFYNQLLYIPIYLENKNEKSVSVKKLILEKAKVDAAVIKIAVLMPYYLMSNDYMLNQYKNDLDFSNRYYNKSEAALSFHIGVELAIDSLRRAGKKLILYTFDTNQDSLAVRKIIHSNQLNDMDIIIGPMYSDLFKIICQKYGEDNSKILISPLSRENKDIKQFPVVYQIALTYKSQAELLTKYLIENKLSERIIILNDKKQKWLADHLKYRFKKKRKIVESFLINHTNVDSIRQYFVEDQNVLLLSKDKVFISRLLASIGSIDSNSTVFGFESIASYDNLDITNLMELDVHIPDSRRIDVSQQYDLKFLSLFQNEYNTHIRKYSKVGYDLIMHFCGKANVYNFKRVKGGYYENISVPISHYLDYELVPVN